MLKGNGWLVDKVLNANVRILQKENNVNEGPYQIL